MKKDRIKISKEFHGINGSMWVGMEAQIDETDNVKQCIIELNNDVEAGYNALNPSAAYGSKRVEAPKSSLRLTDEELESAKRGLETCEWREQAVDYLAQIGFRYNIELNKIANAKPNRPTIGK